MGHKITDKVQLEKIINEYLVNDIPLSLLTDSLDLTYRQIQLLINRTIGFHRQTENAMNRNQNVNYDNIDEDLLNLPHEFQENYPKTHEEAMALFARLSEIRELLNSDYFDKLGDLEKRKRLLEVKVSSYNPSIIARIEKVLSELPGVTDSEEIGDIFLKNGILPKDLDQLNTMYSSFLEDNKQLLSIEKEISSLRDSQIKEIKSKKQLEREYEDIRETLVVCNVKLVNWCIRRFFNNIPLPKEETQLFGFEGLVIALNNFDYQKGFHFSSYAVTVIVRHIERHFEELYGLKWRDFIEKESIKYYRQLLAKAKNTNASKITPQELSELGLIDLSPKSIKDYDEMLDEIVPMSSIYEPKESEYPDLPKYEMPISFEDYDEIDEYEDTISIEDTVDIMTQAMGGTLKESLLKVLSTLTEQEEKILRLRFGIDDGKTLSLEEIAKIYNLSRERIRQIEAKALRKLRQPQRAQKIRNFVKDDGYEDPNFFPREELSAIIFTKLIDLLRTKTEPMSMLKFMQLDYPGWNIDILLIYIKYINNLCINTKQMLNTGIDPTLYDVHRKSLPKGYFNEEIPTKAYHYLKTHIDEILEGLNYFGSFPIPETEDPELPAKKMA